MSEQGFPIQNRQQFSSDLAKGSTGLMIDSYKEPTQMAQQTKSYPLIPVNGTNNALGTAIGTFTITARKKFAVTGLICSTNLPVEVRLGTGAIAVVSDKLLGLKCTIANGGMFGLDLSGNTPYCVIDNTAGAIALTCTVYMPHSADGAATNDAIGKWVGAQVVGYEF